MAVMRPIVLTFIRYYLPGFESGGPVRSLANMVEALGDEFDFRIVCADRDVLDREPYAGIRLDHWTSAGKARVFYASAKSQSIRGWCKLIREQEPDVIYLNSLFNPTFTIKPLLARQLLRLTTPVALAPRGELSRGALAIKAWKKSPFLAIAKRKLYGGVLWHASTEQEATLIRTQFANGKHVLVAENIVIAPDLHQIVPQVATRSPVYAPNRLRVVFLARISRIKNLEFALDVLSQCTAAIEFDIWGTIEDPAYWRECEARMKAMPANVQVSYRGIARPSDVPDILLTYDLLLLPTRGENYGHVIAEAMAVGTPVLISDQTPWRNLVEYGVGWDLRLDDALAFRAAIATATKKDQRERLAWRQLVRSYAKSKLSDPRLIQANRQVFSTAISASRALTVG